MSQISLVLPFACPPPELSADLARALKAPALATLLAKTASTRRIDSPAGSRLLPHEQWLSGALNVAKTAGSDPVFFLHPAHIEIARSHLMLNDLRRLQLSDRHSRALHAVAAPMFEEIGLRLDFVDAETWRLHAPDWLGLDCASPDAAAEQNISDWMPAGDAAVKFRKLQNEIQMLWFEHPANQEREQQGLRPVNAIWPWANGNLFPSAGQQQLYTAQCPPWMTSLGRGVATADSMASLSGPSAVICGHLAAPAIASDWGSWIAAMEQVEQEWLAPLLAAVRAGRVKHLRLLRGSRDFLSESIITPGSLRKFWRAPSLARLAT